MTLHPGRWHRPLLVLAVVMGVLMVLHTAGLLLDSREVTNAAVWLKPLKFSLSIGIYSLTLAWLIGRLPSGARARIATIAGTISAVGLAIEMVIIDGFALVGQSSHVNLSTPLHAAMWHVMAASISAVWVMTFVVAALLFRAPLGDAGRALAIRAGAVIALAGMAIAFLMIGPKAGQVSDYPGLVGAHTVGRADGGPGAPATRVEYGRGRPACPALRRHARPSGATRLRAPARTSCLEATGIAGRPTASAARSAGLRHLRCDTRPADRTGAQRPVGRCAYREHPDRGDHPDCRLRHRHHRDHEGVVRFATRTAADGSHRPLAEGSDMTTSSSTLTITDRRNHMKSYKGLTASRRRTPCDHF